MNILFDSMGAQVQVQNETSNRLNTLYGALTDAGYTYSFTDYAQPVSSQLDGIDVLVILTHQRANAPGYPPAIPSGTSFQFPEADLTGIPEWVSNGYGLLLISNHGLLGHTPDYWPLNDIPLAAAMGITIVAASFTYNNELKNPLVMTPASTAPPAIADGVGNVQVWDSCGISAPNGDVILPIPPDCFDASGNNYSPADYAFAIASAYGSGNVIVAGHSGIAGDNNGITYPSPGEIGDGSNLTFLMNCIAYLGS